MEAHDRIGVAVLLRDIRYNVQAMGRMQETESFVSQLKEMEQQARSGNIQMLHAQRITLYEIWEKYELGVTV